MRSTIILVAALLATRITLGGTIEHEGDWYISGFYEKPVVVGNTAYVANVYGAIALNVGDPASIIPEGGQPGWGYTYGLDVTGTTVYLSNWEDNLLVSDFGDPFYPQLLQELELSGEAWDIEISDTLAAVACGAAGVYILNISDPANPDVLSNFGVGGFAVDVLIDGYWVFVAAWDSGAFCYNINDPTTPLEVGSYTDNPGIVRGLDYSTLGYLYLAEVDFGIEVLYVNPSGNLTWFGDEPSIDYFGVEVDDSRLYACAGLNGMRIYDISSAWEPVLLYSVPTGGEAWTTFIQPELDLLYLADGPRGLKVYDTNDGALPILLGQYENLGQVSGVATEGNVIYFAAQQDSFQVYELVGSSMTWRGAAFAPDSARSVTLVGTNAYVACGPAGVAVYDKSVPFIPEHLITVNTPGFASRVVVAGDTAWVADRASGVAVINITNPGAAAYISNVLTQDDALGMAKSGNLLYVAESTNGLTIYNVANLSAPYFVGGIIPADSATARDVVLYGQYALVAAFEAGLRIINISNPSAPTEAAHIDLPGHARRIVIDGIYAYVALHDGGFAVVDLTDPLNPALNAYHESPGSCVDIGLIGDQIILADTYCLGLYSFDPYAGIEPHNGSAQPQDFALEAPYPNPFNPSTVLSFSLFKQADVSLKIYDLQGRVIAELVSGRCQSGSYQVRFEGGLLSSGIYLARLQTGSFTKTQKLVLLK